MEVGGGRKSDEPQNKKPQSTCDGWRRIVLPADTLIQHPENILLMPLQPGDKWSNAEVTEAHLPPPFRSSAVCHSFPQQLQKAGWMHQGVRCLGALCYLGSSCRC